MICINCGCEMDAETATICVVKNAEEQKILTHIGLCPDHRNDDTNCTTDFLAKITKFIDYEKTKSKLKFDLKKIFVTAENSIKDLIEKNKNTEFEEHIKNFYDEISGKFHNFNG